MIKYALGDLKEVGAFYKSTGVKGELIGELHDALIEELQSITYLFVNHNGQSLPYFIEKIRIDNGHIKFKLENVNNPESATRLANKVIYLDKEKIDSLKVVLGSNQNEIIGMSLYNNDVFVGTIKEILEYPGHNVITLLEDGNLVIPFVEEWIIEVKKDRVIMSFDDEILMLNK